MRVSGDLRLWGRAEPDRLVKVLRHGIGEEVAISLEDLTKEQFLVESLPSENPSELILNLKKLARVDSLGIGALVRLPLECSKRRIALKVILPGGTAGHTLRMVRIFEAWPQYADEEQALAPPSAEASSANPQN